MNEERKLPRVKPVTDIIEEDNAFHVIVDMPGMSKDKLTIDLEGDELRVGGRVVYPEPAEGEKLAHVEFGSGEYHRVFTVSKTIDKENIKATLENGVLTLVLPKAQSQVPRRIEITAG